MHEYNKIQGIQTGFDEVVRFQTCQVVPGFQFGERGMYVGMGLPGVLLPRKVGENGELTLQPHLLGLMAHDLPRTRSRDRTRRNEGNHRHFHVEIIPDRSGNLSSFGKCPRIFDFGDDC